MNSGIKPDAGWSGEGGGFGVESLVHPATQIDCSGIKNGNHY